MSSAKFRLDGLSFGLDLAVIFADNIVVNDPLGFCDFISGGVTANVFGFGSHYCFWFHRFWWDDLHKGSLSQLLVNLVYPSLDGLFA